ncbi:MAG: hypothetical protein ACREVL_02035 [Solimonas sp.]
MSLFLLIPIIVAVVALAASALLRRGPAGTANADTWTGDPSPLSVVDTASDPDYHCQADSGSGSDDAGGGDSSDGGGGDSGGGNGGD